MPGPADYDDLLELANQAIGEWVANVVVTWSPSVLFTGVRVVDLTTESSPVAESSTGLPVPGAQSGASLPNNVALVLTKRTQFRGRSYRGRIYHGGIPETSVTGNTVAAGYVTTAIANYTNLLALTTSLGVWEMVVVSRYTNNAPRSSGIFSNVTGFTSDGVVDSQRRRLPGRGA